MLDFEIRLIWTWLWGRQYSEGKQKFPLISLDVVAMFHKSIQNNGIHDEQSWPYTWPCWILELKNECWFDMRLKPTFKLFQTTIRWTKIKYLVWYHHQWSSSTCWLMGRTWLSPTLSPYLCNVFCSRNSTSGSTLCDWGKLKQFFIVLECGNGSGMMQQSDASSSQEHDLGKNGVLI